MASRTAKSLAGFGCFLRPREWFSLGTEHLLLLLRMSSRQTVDPTCSSGALAKSSDIQYFWPTHLLLLLLAFPHFSVKEPYDQTNATRRTTWKKIALVEHERARNSVISRCRCKHQTPWCKRLKLKWKINFSTRQTFSLLSSANSYFLLSNFVVPVLPCLHWIIISNRKCLIERKLKFVLMHTAFCRSVLCNSPLQKREGTGASFLYWLDWKLK